MRLIRPVREQLAHRVRCEQIATAEMGSSRSLARARSHGTMPFLVLRESQRSSALETPGPSSKSPERTSCCPGRSTPIIPARSVWRYTIDHSSPIARSEIRSGRSPRRKRRKELGLGPKSLLRAADPIPLARNDRRDSGFVEAVRNHHHEPLARRHLQTGILRSRADLHLVGDGRHASASPTKRTFFSSRMHRSTKSLPWPCRLRSLKRSRAGS